MNAHSFGGEFHACTNSCAHQPSSACTGRKLYATCVQTSWGGLAKKWKMFVLHTYPTLTDRETKAVGDTPIVATPIVDTPIVDTKEVACPVHSTECSV